MTAGSPPGSIAIPTGYCADRSEGRGDPMLGSAFPAARILLVEQPGAWGRDGLRDSRLEPAVSLALDRRARQAGVRILAVRRPGRPAADDGSRWWALADTRDGHVSVRSGRVPSATNLPELPMDGSAGDPHPGPLFLVCAHGKHDVCCAMRGRQAASALDAVRPGQVWECSHVGGDRFAANVLVLPSGLLYGRVRPADAAELVSTAEAGQILLRRLRGRVGLPPVAQAALAFAHEQLALNGDRDLRVEASGPVHDATAVVRLSGDAGDFEVTVRVERVAQSGLTCASPGPSAYLAYRPQRITRTT